MTWTLQSPKSYKSLEDEGFVMELSTRRRWRLISAQMVSYCVMEHFSKGYVGSYQPKWWAFVFVILQNIKDSSWSKKSQYLVCTYNLPRSFSGTVAHPSTEIRWTFWKIKMKYFTKILFLFFKNELFKQTINYINRQSRVQNGVLYSSNHFFFQLWRSFNSILTMNTYVL